MPIPARRALIYEKLRPGYGLVHDLEQRGIEAAMPFGPESCLRRHQRLSEDEFIELAQGFQAVIGASAARLTARVIEALPDLVVISKIGIGYDVIDVDAASSRGVLVTNTPSPVEIDSVAEHALALMLAAAKRLDFYTPARMADGGWFDDGVQPLSIRGKTVGLVGFGRIARAVATRLTGWDVQLLATDVAAPRLARHPGVRFVHLPHLLAESDIVSVHTSSAMNEGPVIGPLQLALMKPTAILVNTSRGTSIDQTALRIALGSRRLRGAALDVFEPEPPEPGDPLLALPGVLATPHLGAATPEAEADMEDMAAANVAQVLDGLVPDTVLNPDALALREGRSA